MRLMSIVVGAVLITGGFYLVFSPGLSFLNVGWIAGILLLFAGVSGIVEYFATRKLNIMTKKDLAITSVAAALGIFMIINQTAQLVTTVVATYLFGVWIIMSGLSYVYSAIERKRLGFSWGWMMGIGVVEILVGIYAFFNPMFSAVAISLLIGFYIILAGLGFIVLGLMLGSSGTNSGDVYRRP